MNYDLRKLHERAMKIKTSNDILTEQLRDKRKSVSAFETRKNNLDELQVIVQEAAKRTQDKIKDRFETIVQSCLDVVFPNTYDFHFDFVPRRGKIECDIYLTDNKDTRLDPMNSNGGGVVDVISISLRVACLTMSGKDKVLLLDEPFSHLRGEARMKLGEVLNCLSNKMDLQIIMVGDVGGSSVKADREFMVTKNNNVSEVTEVDITER